jgi:CCR4-NOT transcription complex subunit 4
MIDNHVIRASFGTTKYCSFFLKGIECTNKECLFLHKWAEENDIIKRGDLISNKVIFTQQHNYAKKIADIYNPEVKKRILSAKKGKTVFPSPDIIYRTISVMEKEKNNSKNKKNSTGKTEINRNKMISPVKESKNNKDKDTNAYEKNFNSNKNEYANNKNKSYNDNDEESAEDYEYDDEEEEEDDEDYEYEDDKANNNYEEKNEKNSKQKNINAINNNNKNQQNNKRKKLFFKSEKSRFDFCGKNNEENNNNNNIVVPEHIINLINKKINSYILTKYMQQKIVDKMFINESIKKDNKIKNDEWIKFINDNIDSTNYSNHNSDEFVNDIDNINHFIYNKVNEQTESKNNK